MFGVVLLEVAPEVPHAPLRLNVPAFLACDPGIGIVVGIAGGVRGGSRVLVGGLRLVTSGALGRRRLRGRIYSPESPPDGRRSRRSDMFKVGRS
jgi:hypothetical protein